MKRIPKAYLSALVFALLRLAPARAQSTETFALPEVDAYVRLTSNVRLFLQAKEYVTGDGLNRAQLGPSMEFNLRPFKKLKDLTIFDLDDMKCMPVVLSIGYRYLPSSVGPPIQRVEPVAMFHVPAPGHILVTDRNRADLDWSHRRYTWRYRNRFTAERRVTIRSYHPGPYASAEVFYESQYSKWSSTRLFGGCLLPLSTHLQLDPYYEHVNNTGKHPNQQLNAGGLILSLYFRQSTQ